MDNDYIELYYNKVLDNLVIERPRLTFKYWFYVGKMI